MTKKAKKKKKATGKAVAIHRPQAKPPMLAQPRNMLEVIAAAASDPRVDVTKMQALLNMRRQEQDREAEYAFNEALKEAQEAMPEIPKDKKGAHDIPYATLEGMQARIQSIYQSKGFSLSFGTADSLIANHYRIVGTLSRAGHSRTYFVDLPADTAGPRGGENKSAVQGVGSSMSFGIRYLTRMIFNLRIIGEDNDGAGSAKPISDKQLDELIQMSDRYGVDKPGFCKFMGVDSYAQIPAKRFNEAKAALNGFKAGAAKAKQPEAPAAT